MHVNGKRSLSSTTLIDEETLALTIGIDLPKLMCYICVFKGCIGDYAKFYKASNQSLLKN
jgi:hypothetical protein